MDDTRSSQSGQSPASDHTHDEPANQEQTRSLSASGNTAAQQLSFRANFNQSSRAIGTPQHGTLHKRRASDACTRSPTTAQSDEESPSSHDQLLQVKRRRTGPTATSPTANNETPIKAATTAKDNSPDSISSTTSSQQRRLVLLNKPSLSPLPGTPGHKFCMITALVSHMDVLLNVVRYIPPRKLVYLYSISAPFHYLMDSHYTQFILACSQAWAPNAEFFYPWRCFRELCIDDPGQRKPVDMDKEAFLDCKTGRKSDEWQDTTTAAQPSSRSSSGSLGAVKAVPSFRWLKMVTYREIVSREIVAWLAVHGHRTPVTQTIDAIKKLWFLIDIPMSAPRVALVHNTAYFTTTTLHALTMFFLKLDMYYTDPVCYTGGEHVMREFLLQERTLTSLWNYLRGAAGNTKVEMLRLWVRHGYTRPARLGPETQKVQERNDRRDKMAIMGVEAHSVGRGGYELGGLGTQRLIRPDELVLREGVKRGLDTQRQWLRMCRWGFLDGELRTMPVVKAEEQVLSMIKKKQGRDVARKEEKVSA